MGKVVRFTGSKLLGEELRRLRGARTLDDVVAMGKSRLVEFGFKSVAKGTLSEIENGITLPNLESVFALSILYQVPTSRFLHILLEENLVEDAPSVAPESLAGEYAAALHARRWTQALALAIQGLRRAADGREVVRWRLNRALAIERMGMRHDAINEMHACLESPHLPADAKWRIHRDLSRMHGSAHQLQMAGVHLDLAVALAPRDCPAGERCRLLQAHVALTLRRHAAGAILAGDELDRTEEMIGEALGLASEDMVSVRLSLLMYRACVRRIRGDVRGASRELKAVMSAAADAGLRQRQIEAMRNLAEIEVARDPAAARSLLSRAADLAVEANDIDLAFMSYYDLHRLAESSEQADYFLRKCRRLYPLVQTSDPVVREFETKNGREAR